MCIFNSILCSLCSFQYLILDETTLVFSPLFGLGGIAIDVKNHFKVHKVIGQLISVDIHSQISLGDAVTLPFL